MSKKRDLENSENFREMYEENFKRDFATLEDFIEAFKYIQSSRFFRLEDLLEKITRRLEKFPTNQFYLQELWDYYIRQYELEKAMNVAERLKAINPKANNIYVINTKDNNYCCYSVYRENWNKIPTKNLKAYYKYRASLPHNSEYDNEYNNKIIEEINKRKGK
jgi:hypothetical protein